MKPVKYILLLFILLFSCEEHGRLLPCDECRENEPDKAELQINVEDGLPGLIELKIYEGNLEDNNLLFSEIIESETYFRSVTLNKKYTITATYINNGISYTAVDSAFPRVKYTKDQCDIPCYWVYDRIIDVSLRQGLP